MVLSVLDDEGRYQETEDCPTKQQGLNSYDFHHPSGFPQHNHHSVDSITSHVVVSSRPPATKSVDFVVLPSHWRVHHIARFFVISTLRCHSKRNKAIP
jgi:hypothetical protein